MTTPIPNINVGDTVYVVSRAKDPYGRQTNQIVGRAEGTVAKADDGSFVIVTDRGYRFALEGWSEYKKVPKTGVAK